jgi:ribosomal 50S subunit-associated protein YjgA (DUF615 family)
MSIYRYQLILLVLSIVYSSFTYANNTQFQVSAQSAQQQKDIQAIQEVSREQLEIEHAKLENIKLQNTLLKQLAEKNTQVTTSGQ